MPMHSARVELENAKQSKGISWQTLLICLLIFVTTVLIAYSMVQQGRKRKTLHARIWHPPPSESCMTYIFASPLIISLLHFPSLFKFNFKKLKE